MLHKLVYRNPCGQMDCKKRNEYTAHSCTATIQGLCVQHKKINEIAGGEAFWLLFSHEIMGNINDT